MYNQFFTIKPRISEKNGGSKVVHLIKFLFCFFTVVQMAEEYFNARDNGEVLSQRNGKLLFITML